MIPVSISKKLPRRSEVCFASVTASVLLSPIEPSLKLAHKNILGYEVKSDPSAFSGTVPKVLLTL